MSPHETPRRLERIRRTLPGLHVAPSLPGPFLRYLLSPPPWREANLGRVSSPASHFGRACIIVTIVKASCNEARGKQTWVWGEFVMWRILVPTSKYQGKLATAGLPAHAHISSLAYQNSRGAHKSHISSIFNKTIMCRESLKGLISKRPYYCEVFINLSSHLC